MKSPLARWAAPAAVVAAAFSAAATKIHSYDLWWHLETGRWILQKRTIPTAEVFSFTSAGTAWVDHGWLWQIAAYLLYTLGGAALLASLKMFSAGIVASASWFALKRSGWGAHSSSLTAILVLAGARLRILDRPETAGLACLALFLFVLTAPGLGRGFRFAAGFGICVLWANVHASVLIAPALAGLAAAGGWFGARRAVARAHPDARRLAASALDSLILVPTAAAGALLNPYGARLAEIPWVIRGILSNPVLANPEWLPPDPRVFPFFYVSLVIAMGFCAILAVRGEPGAWRGLLLSGAAGFMALQSIRHLGLFYVTVPFALATGGNPARHSWSGEHATRRLLWSLVPVSWAPVWGIAAAVVFPITAWPPLAQSGFGVEAGRFPEEEASWVREHLPASRRMYNDVAQGGYLIWRFFPDSKVFIDGRNELYPDLLADLAGAVNDGRAWASLLDRHGVDTAMVEYRSVRFVASGAGPEAARSFAVLHFPKRFWALVYWGDAAMVFVKRGAGYDDLIDREEYEFLNPEDWEYSLERCRKGDPILAAGIHADLARRLADSPPSARARDLEARFAPQPGE